MARGEGGVDRGTRARLDGVVPGVALITGDQRALLARESWLTGALGLWILGSLALARPFLLDVAIKISRPGAGGAT
ncbi:MAG: conserved rane protein of unknown function [Amycolatopsis sp.]|jgi:hypothetical protein|uniref:hypothetical protein n=1 Tax=Amycolatopsis sp. TaxID=37632 RepID=UPI002626665C|nr:hypothetical protein [Amycolatopsis sp.]MCU1685879.1 conserved rane protein of unknown function [Amycolatopsis sp.]